MACGRAADESSELAAPRVTTEQKTCVPPSGGGARRRGGTQVGKAPPLPKTTIFGLTRGQVFGEDLNCDEQMLPRLCRTMRPAPQAGCFVSRLYASCESQITLRHWAFGTVALAPSSVSVK